jgi:cytochrome P450
MIAVSPFTVHRDESVYKEPSRFNPERFSKPALEERNAIRQYIPFGAGRHACQGQRLVTLVLRIEWSTLFKDYEVSIVDKQLPQPQYFGALGTPLPKSPVTMLISRT